MAKLSIYYTGAGVTPTINVTDSDSDGLADTITTAFASGGGTDALNLNFKTNKISSINDLVKAINNFKNGSGANVYVAAVKDASQQYRFDPAGLDTLVSATLSVSSGAPTLLYGVLQECLDAVAAINAPLVTFALHGGITARVAPSVLSETSLAGGVAGASTNSTWATAFTALQKVDAPGVVTCESQDGSAGTYGSTHTIASVNAQLDAHCALMSGTGGKLERVGYCAFKGNKANTIAMAQSLNDAYAVLFANTWTGLDKNSNVVVLGEWAWAVAAASARAGMNPGEPLTFKFFRATAVGQDASWSPETDGDDMLLGGVCIAKGGTDGVKIVKGITTYTRDDNDVFVEESIITNCLDMQKQWRELLEGRYTGRPGLNKRVKKIKADSGEFWNGMRDANRIVDSTDASGAITKYAFSALKIKLAKDVTTCDVEVQPVEGINFILNTVRLVPAVQNG